MLGAVDVACYVRCVLMYVACWCFFLLLLCVGRCCLFVADVAGRCFSSEVVVCCCLLFVDGWRSVLSLCVLLHADVVVAWCCCKWPSRVLVGYCLLLWCVVCRGGLLIVCCVFVAVCVSLLCVR